MNKLADSKDRLMALYNPDRGQWESAAWWQQPVVLETLIHFARKVKGDPQDVAALARQVFEKNRGSQFINDYFDDTSWWGLCWLSAYDWTADTRYLKAARVIFEYLAKKGWDNGSCGGGVVWHVSNRYKNAITNEQFLRLSLWLYRISVRDGHPEQTYLDWAGKSWDWFVQSGMLNPQSLVNDGLDGNCRNNGQNPWTYNQGVILGALADLYRIKGNPAYLDQAYRIAEANISYNSSDQGVLLEKGCGDSNCGDDGPMFKGIFIRNLEALLAASPTDRPERARMEKFLARNAAAAWANRLDTGLFGVRWDKVFPGGQQAPSQSSGLDLLLAAPADPQETPVAPKACLYDRANFGGASACYQMPSEIRMLPETLHDRVSSVRVFPGACLTVYKDAAYQGESREISADTSWLGNSWNDQISSLRAYSCAP
jgi:predicted alpha-1,6-mannanase (GH76 family)